jgi:hypothetical protein
MVGSYFFPSFFMAAAAGSIVALTRASLAP